MKIFCLKNTVAEKMSSLQAALLLTETEKVIAFVGGGGKTTLISRLAEELIAGGSRVIITTTTHIKKPEQFFSGERDRAELLKVLEKKKIAYVGTFADEHKMQAANPDFWKKLPILCDYVLVEADGAKHLPLKVPAAHEPVLPEGIDLVIGVAGVDAWGKRIGTICHRPQETAALLGKSPEDIIEAKDYAKIFLSRQGSQKDVQKRFLPLLNKVEEDIELARAKEISACLQETVLLVTGECNDTFI